MSRIASDAPIITRPSNNIYTALLAVAVVAQMVGIIAILVRAAGLFDNGLL